MLFVELKSEYGSVRPEQSAVLDYLRRIERLHGWLAVCVWRPSDWDRLVEILT
jgi:hypothetical protein